MGGLLAQGHACFFCHCCNRRLYSSVFVSAHEPSVFTTLSDLRRDSHFMSLLAQLREARVSGQSASSRPPHCLPSHHPVRGGERWPMGDFHRISRISAGKTSWKFDLSGTKVV